MSENDFMRQQQAAVEKMREMSRKAAESSGQPMPPVPPFVRLQNRQGRAQNQGSAAPQRQSPPPRPQSTPAPEEKNEENFLFPARKGGLFRFAGQRQRPAADYRSAAYFVQRKGG